MRSRSNRFAYTANDPTGVQTQVILMDVPDECPQCHSKGTFVPLTLFRNPAGDLKRRLQVILRCPNSICHEVFIGYYSLISGNEYKLESVEPETYEARAFSSTIKTISPSFVSIYNQAQRAETAKLDQISGPGYRKALEFLVKDYLIKKITDPAEQEKIKKENLGFCIETRITDPSIKGVSKRAVWLGNDETHYVRKWEAKDLQDMKKLVDLTVHWMEAEALTAELLADMPEVTAS